MFFCEFVLNGSVEYLMPGCSASSSLRMLATCRFGRGTTFQRIIIRIANKNRRYANLILLVVFSCWFPNLLVTFPWVFPACGLRVVVDVVTAG